MRHAHDQLHSDDGAGRRRPALRFALALVLAPLLIFASGWGLAPPTADAAPAAPACCSGYYYGADAAKVDAATRNTWPQANGPFCGVETAIAMVNYADGDFGTGLRFLSSDSQFAVASDDANTLAASQWGYRLAAGNSVAGEANISYDFGTDPRSIAYIAYRYTPPAYYYHDYIYRWQMVHASQPSYSQQVLEATTIMGSQLETYGEPLSVAINAGLHSILVTGVYSTNEPSAYFPANITGVTYRDPQDASVWTVDIGTWTHGIPGGYSLWSQFYGNSQDPEPAIGIYKPANGQTHWFGGFNWISRDGNTAFISPDWAYNAYPGTRMTAP